MGTSLVFLAPLLVSLALKVNSLVGIDQAPSSLALVTGIGSLLAMVVNPFFGRMSDRTSSRLGMRRPWMVGGLLAGSLGVLIVALAPTIAVVLVGWCIAQLFFNALLAALVAVLPDQVPPAQRGLVAGILGVCLPIAPVSGTFPVQLFTGNQLAMFLVPCAIGGLFILLFAVTLNDRRLAKADKARRSLREFASAFYVNPRTSPDFAWAFASRFMLLLAYAFLTTYQAYYLLDKIGSAEGAVPHQIFLGTLAQSAIGRFPHLCRNPSYRLVGHRHRRGSSRSQSRPPAPTGPAVAAESDRSPCPGRRPRSTVRARPDRHSYAQ
jgi:MFS family permease